MKLTGIHILLTYKCNLECDHCFVWGSQWQTGTMSLPQLRHVLQQAKDLSTVSMIYFALWATTSISTNAFFGRQATSKAERAGNGLMKNSE